MIKINGIIGIADKNTKEKYYSLIDLITAVKKLPEDEPVHILINSPGGDMETAFSMHDYLRALGRTITTECVGTCASAATIVFLAGDKRIANCPIVIHNPWTTTQGNAEQIRDVADWIAECEKRMEKFYSEKTGQDAKTLSALMDEETCISPKQAIILKFATEAKPIAVAFINNQKIIHKPISKMAENKKTGFWARFGQAFASLDGEIPEPQSGKPPVNSMVLSTVDGEEVSIDREEGAPEVGDTASPDGEWTMPDGSVIIIVDGVITEIRPAEGETEIEALRAENEQLKAELAQAKATARTQDELKVLNAVKMAGGYEKVFAQIKTTYKPKPRAQAITKPENTGTGGKVAEKLAIYREKKGV